ncbi:MAG TPA: glycosyltransferase family 2 protein [bacterium]
MKSNRLIIIPAFNEEKNIANVIAEIRQSRQDFDIAVIDDGSTDHTRAAAERCGATVISLPFNLGIGGAMQTGFKYARQCGYELAVQVDGDGQHLPEEIPKLLDSLLNEKYDVVIGSRYLENNDYKTPLMRRMGMVIFSFINSRIAKKRLTDNTSGFRAYNSRAIKFLAANYPTDYPEVEAVAVLAMNRFKINEVAVRMRQRQFGVSSINAVAAIYYMIKVCLALLVNVFRPRTKMEELSCT